MNKTLKFLLAIALFVAILAIATGVNAAVDGTAGNEYANLATAATAEKNVAEATQKIKQEGNTYTVLKNLDVETLGVPSGSIVLISDGAKLTVKNKVELDNTVIISTTGTGTGTLKLTGGMTVKAAGVLYTNIDLSADVKVYGKVFVADGTTFETVADTTVLTLKEDSVKNKPMVSDKDTVYAKLVVPTATVVGDASKISMTFDLTYAGEKVNKLEVGKKYDFTIVAKYADYELDKTMITAVAPYAGNDEPANIAAGNITGTDEGTITIPTGLNEGDKIRMTVTIAGEKEDLAVVVGTVQPTPTATAEPTEAPATTAPATDDANKGDKDETPKTGDQIIPATALLAVVVVANVVYFAKSKRS